MNDLQQNLLNAAREMLAIKDLRTLAQKTNDAAMLGMAARREPKAWKQLKSAVDGLIEAEKTT